MMQQQQSSIDKIFAYDTATIKSKYDVQNERQRVDRLRQELTILKRKENQRQRRPTISDTSGADTTGSITIQKLQQENEDLHRKLHDMTTQLQKSMATVTLEQSPVSITSNLFPESETIQQQQQQQQTLEISLQEYKNYSKELEHRIEEQMTQHINTVEVLQQQISILQDSLQTTRQRLMTREADIDRLSTELEQNKKRYLQLLPIQPPLPPHYNHHHHHNEFPISPLSMTDSIVEGGDNRHRHNFDTTTTTFTTPHTDAIVTIPQQHDNNNNSKNNDNEDRHVVAITTTNAVHDGTGSGQSVSSSTATTATHHNCNKNSGKSIISTTSSTSYHRKSPQIRSDFDRAKAMEKLEYDRIHNTMLVQQLRQSVLLQQQQSKH